MPKLVDLGPFLLEESYPVVLSRREPPGTYGADGRWYPGLDTTKSINVVVQPAVGVGSRTMPHLSDLPEGIRHEMRLYVWTEERLQLNDVVEWQNEFYRVLYVWDREHDGGYTRAGMGLLHIDSSTEPPLKDLAVLAEEPIPDPPGIPPPDPPPWGGGGDTSGGGEGGGGNGGGGVPPTPTYPPGTYDPPKPRLHPQCGPRGKSAALRDMSGTK